MDNAWTLYKASWTGNCRCTEGVEGEDPGVAFDASAADDGTSEPSACAVTTPARDATGAISLMLSLGFLAAFTGRRRRA
jgi:MYXO-CTERM domain-containing protein